jgi:hypothetical protein
MWRKLIYKEDHIVFTGKLNKFHVSHTTRGPQIAHVCSIDSVKSCFHNFTLQTSFHFPCHSLFFRVFFFLFLVNCLLCK